MVWLRGKAERDAQQQIEEGAMEPRGVLSCLIIGLIAGWLAGKISKGGGFGILGNIVVGIIGATIGAIVLLYVVGLIVKRGQGT